MESWGWSQADNGDGGVVKRKRDAMQNSKRKEGLLRPRIQSQARSVVQPLFLLPWVAG